MRPNLGVLQIGIKSQAPPEETAKDKGLAGEVSPSTKKKGRTVAITAEDMQKRKNDVKARTTLLLALPDEHQLQAIVSHLEFMDVPIEQDDLNQKFLTSLAPEWLVYTIVWRNWKSKVPTVQGAYTDSAQVPTVSIDVAATSLSFDTVYAFIATQPNGSQIKWVILLESADHQGVKTEGRERERESYKKDPKVEEPGPKTMITIDGIRWDWSYMAEEDEASKNHALVTDDEEVPTEYALMAKSSSSSDNKARLVKFNENEIKYCEKIRVLERDIELKDNKIEHLRNELEEVKKEKESIDIKIEKFENASKDLDRLLGSQKLDKDMKGVGFNKYCSVPHPPAQVYSPPKKDLSWMNLPKFVDDTITDYTRPTPSIDVSKSGIPQDNIDDKGYWDIGYSRHVTGNISYLSEYEPFNGGYGNVADLLTKAFDVGRFHYLVGGDSGNSVNGKNRDPVANMCLNFLHESDSEQRTHEFMHIYLASAKHTTDFHQIVDFLKASHIRYALTVRPTVYVSHIRQFWSTAWVETTDGETKILAKVNGRENIAKTPAMPHEALPRVTSLGGGEGRGYSKHKGGVDQGEDLLVGDTVKDSDKSADKGSDSTDEMANVLGTLAAVNILASGGLSGSFPTAAIFTTASVATPTTRVTRSSRGVVIGSLSLISINILSISKKDKGKGKMTEPEQPNQIIREQAERDSEIARIHAERELEMMITKLDRSNEMVAKYLSEYEQAEAGLSHDEKVELIDELLMNQSNAGWKAKDFKGMNFEQIEEKFIPVWEKMQYFVPMNSKLESERLKRPGIQLDKERFKKLKTTEASSTEPPQEQPSEEPKELSEEELKKMMELVPVEELYIEALQSLVKETYSTIEVTDEKAKELWVELKRLYKLDSRDPLWALQRYMHDSLVWSLYDTCGVDHVSTERGHQIFMLVEKDYPLKKGLTTLMLSNKL
nr:hypothetical protein [Tanacetum cinerariifolium]